MLPLPRLGYSNSKMIQRVACAKGSCIRVVANATARSIRIVFRGSPLSPRPKLNFPSAELGLLFLPLPENAETRFTPVFHNEKSFKGTIPSRVVHAPWFYRHYDARARRARRADRIRSRNQPRDVS
jgi:hypothetical protein